MTVSTAMTLILMAIFGTMVVLAFDFPDNARFMPLVVGIPGFLLCGVQLWIEQRTYRYRRDPDDDAELGTHTLKAELRAFGWFLGFIGLVLLVGFLIASPVLVFGYLWLEARARAWKAAVAAGVFTLWFGGMFEYVLGFALHPGIYGGAILRTLGL